MEVQIQITEEELREVFADTLDKGASFCGISISYYEGEQIRTEIGVPYELTRGAIEIGPYFKNIFTSSPDDYHKRKKRISISDILTYKRLELSDIL